MQTRNGEYILSAMTSGIRSNWMKAIRLCMDLQNSSKNKESSVESSASSAVARTNDDMDIDTSSSSSRTSDSTRGDERKKYVANKRRHYSDVNPGNISKMFSIKGLTLDSSKSLSQSVSSQSSGSSLSSSKEPSQEREIKAESSLPSHMDLATVPKHGKYDQYWQGESGSNIPFHRFVEGSDSHVTVPNSFVDQSSKSTDKFDEEERKKRAKSPSAKIKERSRAKSPKLHSPPPGESETKFTYVTSNKEAEKMSVSSDELDYMDAVDVCILCYF